MLIIEIQTIKLEVEWLWSEIVKSTLVSIGGEIRFCSTKLDFRGVGIEVGTQVSRLSCGERQGAAIGCAVHGDNVF